MPRRATSLSNISDLAIAREIDSKYDAVKAVSLKLHEIELITEMDIDGLITQLNEALDFEGITVVAGVEASWNPTTKVLTVPTLQGETGLSAYEEAILDGFVGTEVQWLASLIGAQGAQGIQGIQGTQGLTGDTGPQGIQGIQGETGIQGIQGVTGISAYEEAVIAGYVGTEVQWLASLVGAQGIQGETGLTGATGNGIASVTLTNTVGDTKTYTITFTDTSTTTFDVVDGTDGINGTNGTDGQDVDHVTRTIGTGAAGTTDTYTVWGDIAGTINLGTFTVYNGTDGLGAGDMLKATYDVNNNGIVDNAALVNGLSVATAVPVGALFTDTVYTHPTTDGSLHVPATSTTNSGKVLTAGATAGSMSWQTIPSGVTDHTLLTNIGTNTHSQIDTALVRLANTSGTNTGDETVTTIKTALGITTLSGSNTGDQDLSGYSLTAHNHDTSYEPIIATKNTGFNLNTGNTTGTLALGDHTHTGIYEPADATILKDVDIGVSVEAYDSTILKDADIGVSVQGYDANITTAGNTFNGVSQLVQTDGTGKLPAIDGSLLTNLPSGTTTLDGLTDVIITTPSINQVLKYNGDGWVNEAASESPVILYSNPSYVATAGQTTFNVTYDVGYLEVYVNGLKLDSSDYTATDGVTIVLAVGASLGDLVDTVAYKTAVSASTSSLLAEHIQTGASATSVTISNLDILTDKSYVIHLELKNSSGVSCLYNLFYNGITIVGDYYTSRYVVGTETFEYSAWVLDATSNGYAPVGQFTIVKDPDGRPSCNGTGRRNSSNGGRVSIISQTYIIPVTNITSISIVASATGGIGINSKIRVYKV